MERDGGDGPEQILLSEALTTAIGGRRVRAAVFTTFEFEPEFFELHVLPCLFGDVAWSHQPNVRRQQVADALRGLENIAVFYDRRGLRPEGGSARLDYARVAMMRSRGVFHAKNILLLVENEDEDQSTDEPIWPSLLLVTTSANLTRSGWQENLEVAQILEIQPDERCAVRDDLLHKRGLLAILERECPGGEPQTPLAAIRQFLRNQTVKPVHRKYGGRLLPRLYVGREPFAEFLCDAARIAPGAYDLEIVSPFFEDTADAPTLKALLGALQPRETRIYLPLSDERAALCSKEFYEAVQGMKKDNVFWARLPAEATRWSRKSKHARDRHVHAKVYRLIKGGRTKAEWRDVQVVGSVNLTGAAHAGARNRNLETAMLVDLPCLRRPAWWLSRLEKPPAGFEPRSAEDDAGPLVWHEVLLRYDWQRDRLEYYWKSEAAPVTTAKVLAHGCQLFALERIDFDAWRPLGQAARQTVREHLKGSSLVMLQVGDEPPQPLLVQELGMSQKPSLLHGLTPAEILEYWSLLTPDQRNEFLEDLVREKLEQAGPGSGMKAPRETPESLFDGFAGIFHAFSCLEEHVLEALRRGADKEIRYRLLGTSYDSLPTLADRVMTSPTDPVTAYVTLLCAAQVYRRLRRLAQSEGISGDLLENPEIRRQCDQYERRWKADADEIRTRISWEQGPDPITFFEWYERAFDGSLRHARREHPQEAGR